MNGLEQETGNSEGYCRKCGMSLDISGSCAMCSLRDIHIRQLESMCEFYGYGATMHEASELWQKKDPLGAFVVGPCKASVVKCGCKVKRKCDWCCGSGWLTKHVKAIKNSREGG